MIKRMQISCILVLILLDFIGVVMPSETIRGEYCEKFDVTCNDGEVILMLHANFGRMGFGKCLEQDSITETVKHLPKMFGCYEDILNYMSDKCSGEKSCNVSTSQIFLYYPKICDAVGYLEAEHKCVQAHTDTCTLNVSEKTSVISKSKATACKTLKLKTKPNFSIEIVPIYFIGPDDTQSDGRVQLGEVRDGKSGEPKGHIEMEMGKTGTWNGVPFRVESSSITVGLSTVENATKWMLNVTARGCEDFSPQNETTIISRTRTNVTLRCDLNAEVWTLVCNEDGGEWVGRKECKSKSYEEPLFRAYSGVIIAGSASLAIVLTITVVCMVLYRYKRRKVTSGSNAKEQPRKKKVAAEFLYKEGDREKDFMDNRFSTTAHQQLEPPGMDPIPEMKPQYSTPLSSQPACPMHGFVDPTNGKLMQFNTMGYHPHYNHLIKKDADGLVHPADITSFTMRYHHHPPQFPPPHSANTRIHPDMRSDYPLPLRSPPKDPSRAYLTPGPAHQIYYHNMYQPYTCNPYFGTMPKFGIYYNEEAAPIYNTLEPFPLSEFLEALPQHTPEPLSNDLPTDLTMARKKLTLSREDVMAAEKAPWEEMK